MELFGSLKTFLYNHRKKFVVSGIVVGGSVALFKYARQLQTENQKHKISEVVENIRRQRHFDTIRVTCDKTIISIGKRLEKQIIEILNVDSIVADLKKNSYRHLELWEKLKIYAFTQVCLMIYAHALIVFILKIQFAVVGGYLYKNLNERDEQCDRNIQEEYFSLCVDFINDGLFDLFEFLRVKVTNIVSGLELSKPLTIQNIQDIFWSIQASVINDEFLDNIPSYLRLQAQMKKSDHCSLLQMYEETRDIIQAKELTRNCFNSLLNCAFTEVTRELLDIVSNSNNDNEKWPSKNSSKALATVKILPILHHMVKSKLNHNETDLWIKNLMKCEKLEILSANIYESYC